MNEELEIIGYCSYCKDPIYSHEAFVVKDGDKYHTFCWQQISSWQDEEEQFYAEED